MAILEAYNVKKEFGDKLIFDHVSFSVNSKDKIAIIGVNGSGKTTLLKLLTGELTKDGGSITYASNLSLGYLSQGLIENQENSLYDEMLTSFKDVIALEKKLQNTLVLLNEKPNDKVLLDEYGKLETRFMSMNGYDYSYLIDTILTKFGFTKEEYQRPIMSFSGGERSKVAFSKLLLNKPNLLLLDEPTNHLDISTIEWLEGYLSTYEGAIILVSHDRFFIDKVCDRVIEMGNQAIDLYAGNYSYYLQEKVLRYEQQLLNYKLQQKEIANLEQLIAKFKPKPTKVRLARDREKKLEKIKSNLQEKPTLSKKQVNFRFKDDHFHRVRLMTIEGLAVGYQDKILVKDIHVDVFHGDKIGIIGPNGIGKTTLLKTLSGSLPLLEGKIVKHRPLKIGYIDQNQINLSSEKSLFDYFRDHFPMMDNTSVRTHLGSFLFQDDDVFKQVNMLSGGEKVRLSFAILVMQKYDILYLDEPTNHLDMETKKILESTLKDYQGTIIFISHDRYFIDELATKICVIKADYSFHYYECSYQEYLESEEGNVENPFEVTVAKKKVKNKIPTNEQQSQLDKLEKEISSLEDKIATLQQMLYQEEVYQDANRLLQVENEIKTLENQLEIMEQEYFEMVDEE